MSRSRFGGDEKGLGRGSGPLLSGEKSLRRSLWCGLSTITGCLRDGVATVAIAEGVVETNPAVEVAVVVVAAAAVVLVVAVTAAGAGAGAGAVYAGKSI